MEVQQDAGAESVCLLTPDELEERFPWLSVTDLALGAFEARARGRGFLKEYLKRGRPSPNRLPIAIA